MYKQIFLKRGKEESLKRFHPWIFSGAIHHMDEDIEEGETPEMCIRREVLEETGLTVGSLQKAGIVDFHYDDVYERVYFFKSSDFSGTQIPCSEGIAEWIPKEKIADLNLWEGDRKFLPYLLSDEKLFFRMKLIYRADVLEKSELVSLEKEEG